MNLLTSAVRNVATVIVFAVFAVVCVPIYLVEQVRKVLG